MIISITKARTVPTTEHSCSYRQSGTPQLIFEVFENKELGGCPSVAAKGGRNLLK